MERRMSLPAIVFGALACAIAIIMIGASSAHGAPNPGEVRIHVMPYNNTDAIIVECDGRFGIVDSGEDSLSPDGADARYPLRAGITVGQGVEAQVIAYMKSLGINEGNLDFYIGTHPHSDHIGSAYDVICEFHPKTVYTPYYSDSLISDQARLWDNQFVYDRLIEAVESYDGKLVQYLDPEWVEAADFDFEDSEGSSGEVGDDGGNERSSRTGNPVFMLGAAQVEIMNYLAADTDYSEYCVPDANRFSYAVAVTAPNGRKALLAGDIDDYSQEWSVGEGAETRLAQILSDVDFLKMAHHGREGSNTPDFLFAVMRSATGGAYPVVVQTGSYRLMPEQTIQALHQIGAKHFNATVAADCGQAALVAVLADNGVTTNVDDAGLILQTRSSAPWAFYYLDGVPQTQYAGWQIFDGAWRYFESDGSLAMGWKQVGSNRYYLNQTDGAMATGWLRDGGSWYYLDVSGAMRTGWQKIGGKWYYLTPGSGAMAEGWQKVGGTWYYLTPGSGAMATGWLKDGGTWYYLDDSGAMRTGWLSLGGKWYYLKGSGAMAEGWAKVSGSWYYLRPGSGAMATGWLKDGGSWYYLDASGAMRTGWQKIGGKWYYLKGSGAMAEGWQKVGGKWYYLTPGSGAMATGWLKDGGSWYYLDASGAMVTGRRTIGGVTYLFDSSGALR